MTVHFAPGILPDIKQTSNTRILQHCDVNLLQDHLVAFLAQFPFWHLIQGNNKIYNQHLCLVWQMISLFYRQNFLTTVVTHLLSFIAVSNCSFLFSSVNTSSALLLSMSLNLLSSSLRMFSSTIRFWSKSNETMVLLLD